MSDASEGISRKPVAKGMSGEGIGAIIASRIVPKNTPKPPSEVSVSIRFSMFKLKLHRLPLPR